MLQINNNIDKNIHATFFCDGEKVGVCTNALSFFDALCQIKAEGSNRYTIEVTGTLNNGDIRTVTFKINPDGRLSPATNKHVTLWNDILSTQLLYLEGFNPNFFYHKDVTIEQS